LICDIRDLNVCEGPSDFDVHHLFNVNGILELPFGRGKRYGSSASGWQNQLIGGWQLSGITTMLGGTWSNFSCVNGLCFTGSPSANTLTGGLGGMRPIIVCDPNLPRSERTFDRQYRTECVKPPGPMTDPADTLYQGTGVGAGQEDARMSLGYINTDLTMLKNFSMGGRRTLQVRAEMYNAFNSTQYQGVNTQPTFDFATGQQTNPDAQSAARIANRQAVVDLIQQRRQVAGCTANVAANNGQAAAAPGNSGNAPGKAQAPGQQKKQEQPAAGGAVGEVVCPGSTVTLSGEAGAPAASSNQFPAGTKLKVTNLDNSKSTTVEVTSVSGSCTLLNNAAFEEVREPGKFLIRRARIERVG